MAKRIETTDLDGPSIPEYIRSFRRLNVNGAEDHSRDGGALSEDTRSHQALTSLLVARLHCPQSSRQND